MSRLEKIEQSVAELADDELNQFAEWFDELRWKRWDSAIKKDSEAGKLDDLLQEADEVDLQSSARSL